MYVLVKSMCNVVPNFVCRIIKTNVEYLRISYQLFNMTN